MNIDISFNFTPSDITTVNRDIIRDINNNTFNTNFIENNKDKIINSKDGNGDITCTDNSSLKYNYIKSNSKCKYANVDNITGTDNSSNNDTIIENYYDYNKNINKSVIDETYKEKKSIDITTYIKTINLSFGIISLLTIISYYTYKNIKK